MATPEPIDGKRAATELLSTALARCQGTEPAWGESNELLEALVHAAMLLAPSDRQQFRDWLLGAVTELRDAWLAEPGLRSAEAST